jgi:NAD(P)H-quinone oxidoreductase subunit N
MALITTGKKLIRDLESGALGVYVPLKEAMKAATNDGCVLLVILLYILRRGDSVTCRLILLEFMESGHLTWAKKSIGQGAAVGYVYYVPPIVTYQLEQLPPKSKG